MKLSYQWLKEFLLGLKASPSELAEILSMHVAQVEEIKELNKELDKVIVAEIVEIKPHPNADKLQIARVAISHSPLAIRQIVCGAFNIKVGQKVPLALPGAKLAGGIEIKESTIRGIKSAGMLCAEDELGIGSDHEGIYILPSETKIGEPVNKILGFDDVILEIENKSITHRPDLFGHLGFAREISAILGGAKIKNKKPKIKNTNEKLKNQRNLTIKVEDYSLCPRYMAVVMDNVKVGPSPLWLQNQLRNLGIQSINNIVDITNYVMMEIGQPLHAFDAAKLHHTDKHRLEHRLTQIIIRRAKGGEKLLALDGKEYELSTDDLVIADSKKPIALAGIIGGEKSGVSEQTKTIVIESANFEPVTIRRTSWRLGLRTEAALRFEKGLPVNSPELGIHRAIELIQKLAGGQAVSEIYDARCPVVTAKLTQPKKILINLERVNKIIGLEIEKNKILSILRGLGFKIEEVDLIKTLVRLAKEQIGKPFKYGALTLLDAPNIFDCSSLTRWLYRQIGVELPRTTIEQIEVGHEIDYNNLCPGDLIFSKGPKPHFNRKYPNGVGHVGIYIGQGKIIHAQGKAKKVIISAVKDFAPKKDLRGVRRIITDRVGIVVTVSLFRPDISLEEDLIEEIVRIYGADKISPQPMIGELKPVEYELEFILEREIKNILVGCGFDEVYNYSFETQINMDKNTDERRLEIANPLSQEQKHLRTSLIPGLIKNAEKNSNYFDQFKIFEIGKVFDPNEKKKVAGLIYQNDPKIYFLAKGIIELILEKLGIEEKEIDSIGQIEKNMIVFEIDIGDLLRLSKGIKQYKSISPYPPIKRDLAFLVDKKITWQEIFETVKNIDSLIKEIELFDVFEDKRFEGKRNLAFHIIYQASNRTLKTEEIEKIEAQIIKILKEKFGAGLRNF